MGVQTGEITFSRALTTKSIIKNGLSKVTQTILKTESSQNNTAYILFLLKNDDLNYIGKKTYFQYIVV